MLFRNAKLSAVETGYDPVQRAVGGVVLFLLMMLLYLILKAILGISATGREAALIAPRPDEIRTEQVTQASTPEHRKQPPKPKLKYPLIDKFVFLDLSAKIMGEGGLSNVNEPAATDIEIGMEEGDDSKNWIVQAASFRDRKRAERLVSMLAEKGMGSNISEKTIQGRVWHVVSLDPQKSSRAAQELNSRLRHEFKIKGMILER